MPSIGISARIKAIKHYRHVIRVNTAFAHTYNTLARTKSNLSDRFVYASICVHAAEIAACNPCLNQIILQALAFAVLFIIATAIHNTLHKSQSIISLVF